MRTSTAIAPDAIFAHPARVLAPTLDIARLTTLVEKKVFDPVVLEGRELFFFPAEISSNRLDAYFTRMAETSLVNYAREADEGRSFQNSHRWYELGFGRTLTGELEEDEAATRRVVSWLYTLSGLRLNELSTDDLIAGIRAGIIQDVSIGFYGGEFRCAICGRDMLWDWDCQHVPGLKYQRADKTGEDLAFAWVEDAHLAEVSAVYDGATPGAAILKAQREAEEGRLNDRARQLLEARYRIALPAQRVLLVTPDVDFVGTSGLQAAVGRAPVTYKESAGMLIRDQVVWDGDKGSLARADMDALLATYEGWEVEQKRLQEALAVAQGQLQRMAEVEQRAQEASAEGRRLQEALSAAQAAVEQLKPQARDGEQYRQDLIAEALGEGVRALGEHFSAETYEGLLRGASLEVVKRMRDDWQRQGDTVFAGVRRTREQNEPPEAEASDVPARAYRA